MYFRVKTGYGDNEFIAIDTIEDVERAQYAFLTDSKVVFSNGKMARGKDIISITEDWHSEMGWNPNYQLRSEDWADIQAKGLPTKYRGVLSTARENVQALMNQGKPNLIGKPGKIEDRLLLL